MIDLVAVRLGKEYLAKHGISTERQVQVEQGLQALPAQQQIPGEGCGSGSRDVERGSTLSTTSVATTNEGPGGSVGMAPIAPADTKVVDYWTDQSEHTPPGAQILGVAILEFGILFHSVSLHCSLCPPLPDDSPLCVCSGVAKKLDMTDESGNHRYDPSPSISRRIHNPIHRHHLSS